MAKNDFISAINLLTTFPLFASWSIGDYQAKAQLAIRAINETVPLLTRLAASRGCRRAITVKSDSFPASPDERAAATELMRFFNSHGSDKSTFHDYHLVYGPILKDRESVRSVLEIGLGTNNTDVVSNMGPRGRPGASLRAFRDFLGSAAIFGADIDRRILFQEDRIKTFFVDQTNLDSFAELDKSVPSDLDLVIDDGLHAPDANLATFIFGLTKIGRRGWVVIEDIPIVTVPLWDLVSALLPDCYQPHIVLTKNNQCLYAVKRLS